MAFHPFPSTIIPVLPSRSDSDSPALSPSRINKREFSPGQIRRELRRFLPAMTQARGFSRAGACVVLHYFASEKSSVTVVVRTAAIGALVSEYGEIGRRVR